MTMTTEAKNNSSGVAVTAVAMTPPDIESQQMPSAAASPSVYANNSSGVVVTTVATTALDIESQQKQSAAASPSVNANRDDDAGKGMGIAMVVLLIIGVISIFIFPIIYIICIIASIIIASILTCGCCSDFSNTSGYNLKPNVKRFATATLVSLCLVIILQIIWVVGFFSLWGAAMSTDSQSIMDGTSVAVLLYLSIVLHIMAIIFSALFTWGRGCGAS